MIIILVQALTFIFLAYAYFKVSDEREHNKKFINWIKSVLVVIAAASVIKFGRNVFIILAVIVVGIAVLVKKSKKTINV